MRLEGKRIIVTGAAGGIGRATALRAASEGAKVALFDLNDAAGHEVVKRIGEAARYWHVDVASERSVEAAVGEAAEWMGGVDVLLHIAGVLQGASVDLTEFPAATWDLVLDVNLKGSFLISREVARIMQKERRGVIVLTASGAGVKGGSSSFAYGSSKGGVHGLALVMEQRLAPYGIRVNDVAPGQIDTPLKVAQVEDSLHRSGDRETYERTMAALASPDGVAAVMAFLASDDADYVRGTVFTR